MRAIQEYAILTISDPLRATLGQRYKTPARLLTHILTHSHIQALTHPLPQSLTHFLTHSPTHSLTHSLTHSDCHRLLTH